MRLPLTPPSTSALMKKPDMEVWSRAIQAANTSEFNRYYLHWDKLRHLPTPAGVSHLEWWFGVKMSRMGTLKRIGLTDKKNGDFQFSVPELVLEELHQIDLGSGGIISLPEPINNPNTRDRYLARSLMEEAITSSQLEGAITTREVAKDMIRTGRAPRDEGEQMVMNNYTTMRQIRTLREQPLSREMVFSIHRMVTQNTLKDPTASGRFRRTDENIAVVDDYGNVFHDPPNADELDRRMAAMCAFANGEEPKFFVHPAIRAIILHFWLAYDHPFVDGNGRTARALFYWSMSRSNYWLFEFISISTILRKAPSKYVRSFIYSETDENDLTHFIVAQAQVIRRAIKELHSYIARKTLEMREIEVSMRALDLFNHRQVDLIRHAMKHPGQRYTILGHVNSQNIAYQTARSDLIDLKERGVLEIKKGKGKQMLFVAPNDLGERMARLEKEARQ